jgi:hypothetical protein
VPVARFQASKKDDAVRGLSAPSQVWQLGQDGSLGVTDDYYAQHITEEALTEARGGIYGAFPDRRSSGSLAMLAAIRRASSRVSALAATMPSKPNALGVSDVRHEGQQWGCGLSRDRAVAGG